MAKLKFDRSINIILSKEEKTTVPNDELWRGSLACTSDSYVNGNKLDAGLTAYRSNLIPNVSLGGGYENRISFLYRCGLQNNVVPSAKEVSLA